MPGSINLKIQPEEIIEAVKAMKKKEREAFIEDLVASASPQYRFDIQEARKQYRSGKVKTHDEVFGS
jgi:hypothetical protein